MRLDYLRSVAILGSATLCLSFSAIAVGPVIQSPSPIIYLADNLDEKDLLGWCIDTQGRGFSENLHAHSCKPRGGDTQFSFDEVAGLIRSVEFLGKCMTLNEPADSETVFGLFDCREQHESQLFDYDADTLELKLATDSSQCVVVGEASRSAGPFMSRVLTLKSCADVVNRLKQWKVIA